VAYALGQKGDESAVAVLIECLKNDSDSMSPPPPKRTTLRRVPHVLPAQQPEALQGYLAHKKHPHPPRTTIGP